MDVEAELRATFNAGGRSWGLMHASRADTPQGFDAAEITFMETVAPTIGRALRASLITGPADPSVGRGPGMVILDADAQIVSATPEAVEWFGEVQSVRRLVDPGLGVSVPSEVYIAAQEARTRAAGFDAPAAPTRMRARTHGGAWLLIHASCLRGPDGAIGHAAVVIEPAKASEVAPLIVEAYELTPREVEVTCAVARGLTTPEIAALLHLSRYTVQDHLKAVYEKVGVSGRGELVAKMFADHYHDGLRAAVHSAAAAA
jgi:DNA-binding CsgD family transcriptional regulator